MSTAEFHSDPGTPATREAYDAVADQFRRLKWTRGQVREWLAKNFGVELYTELTDRMTSVAHWLLIAAVPGRALDDTPAYVELAARFRAERRLP
jgi:hypothetical protein